MSTETNLTQAMREYARAIRGDWSDFDGRSERNVIESWVDEIETPTGRTLLEWRRHLGICEAGAGHWCGSWSAYCGHVEDGGCGCPCTL